MIDAKPDFATAGALLKPVADQSFPATFVKGFAGIAAIAAAAVAF